MSLSLKQDAKQSYLHVPDQISRQALPSMLFAAMPAIALGPWRGRRSECNSG